MHLGNGIICPVTGIQMLAIAAGAAYFAFKKAKNDFSKEKIMPSIALTLLVFALQMINFSIPQTGSSGHIIGGILLAALLGPYTAFLSMCAILIVQAVFFNDGGLSALGCNIFNMAFLACFIAYPLFYKTLAKKNRMFSGALIASVIALQMGAISAVIESALSGTIQTGSILEFTGLMQAIHLPIGIVEGIVTGSVILAAKYFGQKKMSFASLASSFIISGFIYQYASTKPDGLEWSLMNISFAPQAQNMLYTISSAVQSKTAVLSSLTPSVANIAGMIILAAFTFCICQILLYKKAVKEEC